MATTHHNISGELTQELLAAGDEFNVKAISLANVHASTTCTVDLYIEKQLTGKFYLAKNLALPVGTTLVLEGGDVRFSNGVAQFRRNNKLNYMKYIGREVMTSPIIGDITFTHNQNTTSNTWVITHNLGRFPSVTVVDSGNSIVQGTVVYNSNKQLTITFFSGSQALAFQGKAYLN